MAYLLAPKHGPFRERFEEYILERTANHPSLVPMIMDRQGKACFRLACKETLELDNTDWSSWLDQGAPDGPDRVLIDQEISACLRELGYSGGALLQDGSKSSRFNCSRG